MTVVLIMGRITKMATPSNSDVESAGDAFTDGDFDDSDEETTIIERSEGTPRSQIPVNETVNADVKNNLHNGSTDSSKTHTNGLEHQVKVNGLKNGDKELSSAMETRSNGDVLEFRRDSHGDQNPSIVGIIGDQHSHVRKLYNLQTYRKNHCIFWSCVTNLCNFCFLIHSQRCMSHNIS